MKRSIRKKESWVYSARRYLAESKFYVSLAVALFVFSGLVAFFDASSFSFLDDILRGLVDKTEGLSPIGLIWFIFRNNSGSAFFAIFAGILFGAVPFSNILVNGAILGYVVSKASAVSSVSDVLLRIIPHGVFELPAIFIAVGLGIKLGLSFFGTYFGFYSNNWRMKRFGSLGLAAFIIGMMLFIVSSQSLSLDTKSSTFFIFSFFFVAASCFWLLFLLFGSSKLRSEQLKTFRYRLVSSFHVFVTIIIPLLIIAAIIEGILIAYL